MKRYFEIHASQIFTIVVTEDGVHYFANFTKNNIDALFKDAENSDNFTLSLSTFHSPYHKYSSQKLKM